MSNSWSFFCLFFFLLIFACLSLALCSFSFSQVAREGEQRKGRRLIFLVPCDERENMECGPSSDGDDASSLSLSGFYGIRVLGF